VITGATSGIGRETAFRFAAGGANLVLVCRNQDKADRTRREIRQAHPVDVTIVQADFTDLESVRTAAEAILASCPKIDMLIHNAGIFLTKKTILPNGIEATFCVDHLASFLLTTLLWDRMRATPGSRILYVNSEGHRFSKAVPDDLAWEHRHYTGLRSYGAAKSAQLLTIAKFAAASDNRGPTVNAMHPGAVKSNIGNTNGLLYRLYARLILSRFLKSPAIAAEALYFLATDPSLAATTGRFFNQTIEEIPAPHASDMAVAQKVWDRSRSLCGLSG
jgi:NAD(P)-dependent dehydrogenase (short-subunit alcohol dehydrogenase family)